MSDGVARRLLVQLIITQQKIILKDVSESGSGFDKDNILYPGLFAYGDYPTHFTSSEKKNHLD
jgi:hypothetical protein